MRPLTSRKPTIKYAQMFCHEVLPCREEVRRAAYASTYVLPNLPNRLHLIK